MSKEMKNNALELFGEEAKKEKFAVKKELNDAELEKVAGGTAQYYDSEGNHVCGVLSDNEAFELCYTGRRTCEKYRNNGGDVLTAPNLCSVCFFYFVY